jgi:AbrB family looped-hinge helix DNA binding protein
VTIPVDLREKLNLHEGSMLEVEERDNATLLKPASPLEAGKIVGQDEYKRIRRELETTRKNWR